LSFSLDSHQRIVLQDQIFADAFHGAESPDYLVLGQEDFAHGSTTNELNFFKLVFADVALPSDRFLLFDRLFSGERLDNPSVLPTHAFSKFGSYVRLRNMRVDTLHVITIGTLLFRCHVVFVLLSLLSSLLAC